MHASIAIGSNSAPHGQGSKCIALGFDAGSDTNSIQPDGSFYIGKKCIRDKATFNQQSTKSLCYEDTTGEIFYKDATAPPKNKTDATTLPDLNEDSSPAKGYSVGSMWVDTTNHKTYTCTDATIGKAVWVETSSTVELNSLNNSRLITDPTALGLVKLDFDLGDNIGYTHNNMILVYNNGNVYKSYTDDPLNFTNLGHVTPPPGGYNIKENKWYYRGANSFYIYGGRGGQGGHIYEIKYNSPTSITKISTHAALELGGGGIFVYNNKIHVIGGTGSANNHAPTYKLHIFSEADPTHLSDSKDMMTTDVQPQLIWMTTDFIRIEDEVFAYGLIGIGPVYLGAHNQIHTTRRGRLYKANIADLSKWTDTEKILPPIRDSGAYDVAVVGSRICVYVRTSNKLVYYKRSDFTDTSTGILTEIDGITQFPAIVGYTFMPRLFVVNDRVIKLGVKLNSVSGYAFITTMPSAFGIGAGKGMASSSKANGDPSGNSAFGYEAWHTTTTNPSGVKNSTAIGYRALPTGDNQIMLGNSGAVVHTDSSVVVTSDRNDKADIDDIDMGLDFINSITPRKYKYDYRQEYVDKHHKDTGEWIQLEDVNRDGSLRRIRTHYGFIAQEIESVLNAKFTSSGKHALFIDDRFSNGSGNFGLRYEEFIAPMAKAIQELSAKVDILTKRVEELSPNEPVATTGDE